MDVQIEYNKIYGFKKKHQMLGEYATNHDFCMPKLPVSCWSWPGLAWPTGGWLWLAWGLRWGLAQHY